MKKWTPVYETFDCPGKIRLIADELGIIIERGKKALATTEWPGENIRICEAQEETAPALLSEVSYNTIKAALISARYANPYTKEAIDSALTELKNLVRRNEQAAE